MGVEVAGASTAATRALLRSVGFGLLASLGLAGFYMGTVAFAQDWEHAVTQLGEDLPFVLALTAGFGVQFGLFVYIRALRARTHMAGVAAGAGASGVAMVACCAHHLAEALPLLGLSAAATFLGAYRTPFLWLSVTMNAGGVAYLVWQLRRAILAHGPHEQQATAECHVPVP